MLVLFAVLAAISGHWWLAALAIVVYIEKKDD